MRFCRSLLATLLLAFPYAALAQSTSAALTGLVDDPAKAVIVGAQITAINTETGVRSTGSTNGSGQYVIPNLAPGKYRIEVDKLGFKGIIEAGLVLHVQDVLQVNFHMAIGSASETVTVTAGGVNINTTDASVSTVIDRQFVENMPLNGRSFQDLMTLAPGVDLVTSQGRGTGGGGVGDAGEITVNGQRTEANYFTVDGVSANTGTMPGLNIEGAGISGGTPGETVLGTTQSMVSIDALQEFRATTSTYSAEYGRTPGGQFAFTTRSGTNEWNGSAYDYFRNEALDANNWFNNYATPKIPRLPERQNDFGGTLGGPIVIPHVYNGKDKTFLFFSYEGLRLTVPQPFQQFSVPDMTLRQQAPTALQPFLNQYPKPNGGENGLDDGLAYYNQAYSAPSSLDTVGIRIDHSFGDKFKLFGRYANAPSSGWTFFQPADKQSTAINVQTLTVGATSSITPTQANELRFNITQNNLKNNYESTSFGGAIPFDLSNVNGPNGQAATSAGTVIATYLYYDGGSAFWVGSTANSQRQYNVTDTYTWSHAAHRIKFGVDWRRLTTFIQPVLSFQEGLFFSEASVLANSADAAGDVAFTAMPVTPVYNNYSTFVQDEWKASSRLSLSLGLRWDINPAPGNLDGPSPYTADQTTDLATTKLAPENTPLWNTDWHGFAPRAGLAYQLRQTTGHETVLRTGFGLFYDMGSTQGSQGFQDGVGFATSTDFSNVPLPLTSAQVTLPPPSTAPPYSALYAFDPNLKLPYTMQWNVAIEQGLGAQQTLAVSYVGSGGRKLLAQFGYVPGALGNPNFQSFYPSLYVTANRASSGYNSLQVKYQRNLSHGLQALASYTWSHSIDDSSSNFWVLDELLRSSSDFDIRHNFQGAITYNIPGNYTNPAASAALTHWGLDARVSGRSASPIDLVTGDSVINPLTQSQEYFHPDLVSGQPVYLYNSKYPGGRIINYNAFVPASAGVDGNTPRNFARGFDAVQTNIALRRDFPIHERLHLQFRAEAFNLFNHGVFGSVYNELSSGPNQFGYAYSTLNSSLGGLNPLYQIGGPRSLQLMFKLAF